MSLLATYPVTTASQMRSATIAPRRIAKASYSNVLCNDGESPEESWDSHSTACLQLQTCQSGTIAFAPLWNGSSLQPNFVAQVLGQVMMVNRQQAAHLAAPAYRRIAAQIPAALLFDHSV